MDYNFFDHCPWHSFLVCARTTDLTHMGTSTYPWIRLLPKAYIYFSGYPIVQMFVIYHGMGQFEAIRESVFWIVFKEAYWCALIAFASIQPVIRRKSCVEYKQTPSGEIEQHMRADVKINLYRRIMLPGLFAGTSYIWRQVHFHASWQCTCRSDYLS